MKRVISLLLCVVFIAGAAGCAKLPEPSEHGVICLGETDAAKAAAEWLDARIADDAESGRKAAPSLPVIVGTEEKAKKYDIDLSSFTDDGYVIKSNDEYILVFAKTDAGLDPAVRYLANKCDYTAPVDVSEGGAPRVGEIVIEGTSLSEYVIEMPADADDCMKYAADALRTHLGDACGVYPEIVTDGGHAHAIRLVKDGTGKYEDEAFHIVSGSDGITITGGRYRGCMNGVYTFLYDYIGYRFLYDPLTEPDPGADSAIRYVYKAEKLDISGIDLEEFPSIKARAAYGNRRYDSPANYYNGEGYFNRPEYGGYGIYQKACHGIGNVFFSADDLDAYGAGYDNYRQPCYTDEAFLSDLVKRVRDYADAKLEAGCIPGYDFNEVDVAQLDVDSYCSCPNCLKCLTEEGTQSGALVRMANRVAKEALYDLPEVKVSLLGYTAAIDAPRRTKPCEQVQISFCFYVGLSGTLSCSNHSIGDDSCFSNRSFIRWFNNWKKVTDEIYVWYYPMTSYYFLNTGEHLYRMYDDVKYLADNDVYGIFSLLDADPTTSGFVMWHLYQRLQWNADITYEEYLDMLREYLHLLYGDGADAIYDYIAFLDECGDMTESGHWCSFLSSIMNRLSFTHYKEGSDRIEEWYNEAMRGARTAAQETAIDMFFAHTWYLRAVALHTDAWVNGDDASREEYKRILDTFAEKAELYSVPLSTTETSMSELVYLPEDYDYDTPPLEYVGVKMGDWNDNYNY